MSQCVQYTCASTIADSLPVSMLAVLLVAVTSSAVELMSYSSTLKQLRHTAQRSLNGHAVTSFQTPGICVVKSVAEAWLLPAVP